MPWFSRKRSLESRCCDIKRTLSPAFTNFRPRSNDICVCHHIYNNTLTSYSSYSTAYEPNAFIESASPRSTSDDATVEILTQQHPLANNVQQAAAVLDQAVDESVRTSQDSKGDMVAVSDKSDASSNLDVPFLLMHAPPDIADISNSSH